MTDTARIKELLVEWSSWYVARLAEGYPHQTAFAVERVQTSGSIDEMEMHMPREVARLNREIERLAPAFKRIIALEYLDKRPQKTKAAVLGIPRQVFSQRLLWIHEQLNFTMFGG